MDFTTTRGRRFSHAVLLTVVKIKNLRRSDLWFPLPPPDPKLCRPGGDPVPAAGSSAGCAETGSGGRLMRFGGQRRGRGAQTPRLLRLITFLRLLVRPAPPH